MTDTSPARGDVWWVNLEPTLGAEMTKTRPAVVLSTNEFGHLPLRLVVPLTTWQPRFARQRNKVRISASGANGLQADSAADVLQLRAASTLRFVQRIGRIEDDDLLRVVAMLVRLTEGRNR